MRYHLSSNGEPSECRAEEGNCPLNSDHFDTREESYAALEKQYSSSTIPSTKTRSATYSLKVHPMAGGRYFGSSVPIESIEPFLQEFRQVVGNDEARILEEAKSRRDRGVHYHITVIRPGEKDQVDVSRIPEVADYRFIGLGSASSKGSTAWFAVVESPTLDQWRRDSGLPKQDFHVTLGFSPKDVHDQPKDRSSLIA